MKDYFKGYYKDLKGRSLKDKIFFMVSFIGLLPVIFSVFAMEAYSEGADTRPVVFTMFLNATILWTFIALVLL